MKKHLVTFVRDFTAPADERNRAVCTCGWSMCGDLETIQSRASTHDLDEMREAGEKPLPYASGLPEK